MDAYVVEAVRTPRGKGREGGALSGVKPIELLAQTFQALDARTGAANIVEDIVIGCVTETGEQGANIGKIGALFAGWPPVSSGVTVNSFCASGLTACALAAQKVASGAEDAVVAGGVESMSRVPMFGDQGPYFADRAVADATRFLPVGIAADLIATREGFSREDLDTYAVTSHQRAAAARADGRFDDALVPVMDQKGKIVRLMDENIREDSTVEKLGSLPAAFEDAGRKRFGDLIAASYPDNGPVRHLHTVANSPAAADGAAAVLIVNEAALGSRNLTPRARIVAVATAADCPVLMLTAGGLATEKALAKAGLEAKDIDVWEVNEAFAVVPLKMIRDFEIDPEKFNPNGGSIALGHAMGATGAMLVGMAIDELDRTSGQYALVSVVGAAGIAAAMVVQRV